MLDGRFGSFDPKRRELLKLNVVTGGALAMAELWPGAEEADAVTAALASARESPDAAPLERARPPSQNAGGTQSMCPALHVARGDKPGLTIPLRPHA